mgnify:CR=1 FL=1
MDNITLQDYSIVPKDYVCPICGHNFWDLECPHSEWRIIQHFEKVVRTYANHDNWEYVDGWDNACGFIPWGDGYKIAEEALK